MDKISACKDDNNGPRPYTTYAIIQFHYRIRVADLMGADRLCILFTCNGILVDVVEEARFKKIKSLYPRIVVGFAVRELI